MKREHSDHRPILSRFTGLALRFDDGQLEAEFRRAYDRSSLDQMRIAAILGLGLHVLFGIMTDHVITTGHAIEDLLRYGIAMPMVALPLVCSFLPWFHRVRTVMVVVAMLTTAITLNITFLVTDLTDDWVHSANMLLLGFNFLFVGLRFGPSLIAGAIQTIAMEATLYLKGDISLVYVLYSNTFFFGLLVITATGAFMLERSQRNNFLQQRRLDEERARTERLLLNILPAPVADRLRAGPGIIADRFHDVSVLFADLVGFTKQAGGIDAEELVRHLDRVFSRFDDVVERNRLEKIKTIGDAYMAVSGVPIPRQDHADALAISALQMLDAVNDMRWPGGDPIELRIGIASGPAVAGVIGRHKFAFDLWGDTVNMASRMESNGEAGVIQVTRSTYDLLRDKFRFNGPFKLNVKGKGELLAWHLTALPLFPVADGLEPQGSNALA